MKIFITIFFFFVITLSFGQHDENAPWMMNKDLNKNLNSKSTLIDISTAFNNYWKNKDYSKKGSGFKPFKRWENHWNNYLLDDGTIATPDMIWNATQQSQSIIQSEISNWSSVGPFTTNVKSGQGRINTFIIDPNNANTFYVGAPSGGIWKSTDSGITWLPLSDHLPQIGVSGIAIDPNDSKIIYISTGDDDARDTYSVGVLKSIDGGASWGKTGLDFSSTSATSNEIYIHPNNSDIIWVSTNTGFYKSSDAGKNWDKNLSGNIKDFKLKPGDPTTIYAVSGSKFYKSEDSGDNFVVITSELPVSSSRFAVDVSPANPNIVYVLSAKTDNSFQGLYKSTDSGDTFTKTGVTTDIFGGSRQAWYDMALTVSPANADFVFVGVLDIWRSIDGGETFSKKNDWRIPSQPSYTHADIHFLRFFNNKLYAGTDGGIYESTNNANSFTDLTETLNISQYYRISTAKTSAANIAGGLQDNGGFARSNNTWHVYHGGDGMDNAVDPNNKNTYYGFTQFGSSLNVTYNAGETQGGTVANAPSDETNGSSDRGGNWITPLVSNDQSVLYAGYSKLYKYENNDWQAVSGKVFGGDLNNIAIAASNNQIIFTSRSNKLFKSVDGGVTFNEITFIFPRFISSIAINNQNSDIIYISNNGFNGAVYKSNDGGDNWTDISFNLPNEPKLVIKHQNQSLTNDLYLGTIIGVYHINDNMTEWELFANNLPNVPINDIEINIEDELITVGTYGRGVWQSPIVVNKANKDISLLAVNTNNSVQCNGITPKITIKNNGLNSFNSIDIVYYVDDEPYEYTYTGAVSPNEIIEIELPNNNNIDIGFHSLRVEATVANDSFSDNNILYATFTSNNSGEGLYINTFGDVNEDIWLTQTLGNSVDLWQKGLATTTLFLDKTDNSYITNPTGNYTDETTSYLISPCYDLSKLENPILKFDMVFDIELDWDVLYLEYSINSGESWHILGTANDPNWYNSDFIDAQRPITVGKQWTGTDATLKEYSFNLSSFSDESNIIFRFIFATDQAENGEGASIDNFTIAASAILAVDDVTKNSLVVFPNPSTAVFNIRRQSFEKMDISVFDITGKLIFQEKNIYSSYYSLNLSQASKGIYFLKIVDGNNQIAKRLIVY